jgi:hypothetical protein
MRKLRAEVPKRGRHQSIDVTNGNDVEYFLALYYVYQYRQIWIVGNDV